METWKELKDFFKDNYKVVMDDIDSIIISLPMDDEKEQPVLIRQKKLFDDFFWLYIESPAVTSSFELDLDTLNNILEFLNNLYCGGLIKTDAQSVNIVSWNVRHSMPMENLSLKVLISTMTLVSKAAHKIAQMIVEKTIEKELKNN